MLGLVYYLFIQLMQKILNRMTGGKEFKLSAMAGPSY